MSDLLSLGLSGLTAYRGALAAVGENVANAETPGFARRTVRLQAGTTGMISDPVTRDNIVFGGVSVTAVNRAWDMFRAAEARHASAGAGRGAVREQWLTGIETALDDGAAGVGQRLTAFFNAADTLASAPNDVLNRGRVLLALEEVAGAFRTTATGLARIADGIEKAAQLDVAQLNQSMTALADINRTLVTAPQGGTIRASLEDERDRLIDQISARVDVLVTTGDDGTATLRLADAPGSTIIGTGTTGQFGITAAADGRLSVSLTTPAGTIALTPVSGRLAGYVETSATTADRRGALDDLALDFTQQINDWSAAGRVADGSPGAQLLNTADAASMRVWTDDPAAIAAASAGGAANGNLLALAALRGEGGAEQRWTAMVAGHAQQLAATKSEAAATAAWRDNAFAALDATTGIDLDREAADLLRFQQAYSAAARIIQVGRETFTDLLNAI